ncbi:hypothetical protein BGZ99_001266 [Dissophora globulifera]|uniref:T6SS Phospholipase effector Tle1-like catalytic domain-containing protein n=1 Tax=Dissophora globulifera TaxID=979702 RepID=A0A9P6R2Y4_9FUNG|nr:hypothetical protein BGZ99_001266 [Dissophora globulifera]
MPDTSNPVARRQKLIVLCDGTWCGSETNTQSNINLLAGMIGAMPAPNPTHAQPIPYGGHDPGVQACYFPGSGLGGTFLEYLFNATSGDDIAKDCIEVYRYIVTRYSRDQEIWMFGLSRGSYTVRCVAGMINNCGIIKMQNPDGRWLGAGTVDRLCHEVYNIYRSPYPEDRPNAKSSMEFKRRVSHDVPTPIKFMGLLDTVGAMGVPKFDSGIGLTFPQFHDQIISSVVEKVYHACAIHDRLWIFEPCRAFRVADPSRPELEVHERWFPGCHYDIGRQRFRFFPNGKDVIQRTISWALGPLSNVIEPNHVLADLVLKWMLESIEKQDPHGMVIRNIDEEIANLNTNMKAPIRNTGSGDVYGSILDYGPGGQLYQVGVHAANGIVSYLNKLFPLAHLGTAIQDFFDLKLIINVLAATRDRRIGDHNAVLTLYKCESIQLGGQSIQNLAWIDPQVRRRYPSRTYENFQEYLTAIQGIPSRESRPD